MQAYSTYPVVTVVASKPSVADAEYDVTDAHRKSKNCYLTSLESL